MFMIEDIHPLCNEHYSEMIFVTAHSGAAVITDHGCTRAGCTRHYDPASGYYDFIPSAGRLQGKYDSPYDCGEHQFKLYLESYNRPTNTEVWRCPGKGCARTETVRVAA